MFKRSEENATASSEIPRAQGFNSSQVRATFIQFQGLSLKYMCNAKDSDATERCN